MESKEEKYIRARERVKVLKKFYANIASYILVISLLAGLNYYTNEWRNMWFLWVAFFWGLGIVIEAGKIFGMNLFFGKDWESKKIKEIMEEEDSEITTRGRWE